MSMIKEVIGDATIYCGDCRDLWGEVGLKCVDLLLTDPPYGITYNEWDKPIDLDDFWGNVHELSKDNAAQCVFSRQPFTAYLIESNRKNFRYELIWKKTRGTRFMDANKMPLPIHENIEIFYKALPTYNIQETKFNEYKSGNNKRIGERTFSTNYAKGYLRRTAWIDDGLRYPTSVIETAIPQAGADKFHPTQKPLALMEWFVRAYSNRGDLVFDPFMGSGTTGVAALKMGRRFIGFELKRKYFDAACRRLEKAHYERSLLQADEATIQLYEQKQAELIRQT